MSATRKSYPSDVSDAEWEFLLPYLALMREDAPQRSHDMREVFNAVRYVVRTGCQWRMLPHDLPDWTVAYQQARRWMQAGVFEEIVHDLRVILRLVNERNPQPSASIMDGRTLQSTPESGDRAGYDGAKKKHGSKVHAAVDTMGNLLALKVTAANEQEREQVAELALRARPRGGAAKPGEPAGCRRPGAAPGGPRPSEAAKYVGTSQRSTSSDLNRRPIGTIAHCVNLVSAHGQGPTILRMGDSQSISPRRIAAATAAVRLGAPSLR